MHQTLSSKTVGQNTDKLKNLMCSMFL